MKKVLVTEPIHEEGLKILKEGKVEVVMGKSTKIEKLMDQAIGCHGILIRSAQIPGELIKNIPALKVIAKHGVGVDNIDVKTATDQGVLVVNAPESNINAVAEHALGMILSLSKNLLPLDSKVREGKFGIRREVVNLEMKGKTVGLIGLGKIATLLAEKLKALGVKLIAFDPFVNSDMAHKMGIELVDNIDKIFSKSDFISVHVPLNEKTKGMIGKQEFSKMKKDAYFINVARGPIVNEKDLYEALKEKVIKGAAIDVFEQEPPASNNPLFQLENILISPHNAALTDEALIAMATHSAQGVVDYLNGKKPKYIVNPEVLNK
ncbi:hydroxyacid dehydrogenase [Maledivibacter halophilus]|uniref:D-3-phosphoglycerate dehydrogenase n=1 Tax=Maledivibacter halophilus TaxID=36842 RepID=A0A1T5IAR4_9FIRM|nr:hydroxyacid dehydrogenase [Maledivibacter halophilus]SKC36138.1 D-3-phosphoglycerate dehydrogenase [Maledivibacter halophilus]